jgi:hypothetical protein
MNKLVIIFIVFNVTKPSSIMPKGQNIISGIRSIGDIKYKIDKTIGLNLLFCNK